MNNEYFKQIEHCEDATQIELSSVVANLNFDARGLVPVVTQDADSKEVLMLAWMNEAALFKTLSSGMVTYWSRSRNELWEKGLTSGHTQELVSLSIDCDGDALLCMVNQKGAACHTYRRSCFYLKVDGKAQTVNVVGSHGVTTDET